MENFDAKPPRRVRLGVAMAVVALHLVLFAGLIRAFAPDLVATVVRGAVQAFDVPIEKPKPLEQPAPASTKQAAPREEGEAAPEGKKANPRPVSAPVPVIPLSPKVAPRVASTGHENSAGASAAGEGTGAGGEGDGLGSGRSGAGTGGGGQGTKPVKIAGDIVSARDYPRKTRDVRLGSSVTVMLTITPQGRVGACRIARASRDPQADKITCQLATERFRFRPAQDASGRPIESVYGWQQRWFTPASSP